ncbi:MAG: Ig-like domain-containing protein [Gemmatimonadales bacterium]
MTRSMVRTLLARLMPLVLAGCQDGCGCGPTETTSGGQTSCTSATQKVALVLEIVGGNGQAGQAGATVPEQLHVALRDATFAEVPDVEILFDVRTGDGRIDGLSRRAIVTNSRGRAVVAPWLLGPVAGPNTVEAVVSSNDIVFQPGGKYHDKYHFGSPAILSVVFTAQGTAGPPNTMTASVQPTQGPVGQPVSPVPAVKITDALGNPVAGISVSFVAIDGNVTGGSAVTDPAGVATVGSWTLSGTAAPQRLRATANAAGINPSFIEFVVQGLAGQASKVTAMTPVSIAATPNSSVNPRPAVRVEDQHGNPTPGVTVTFAEGSTGGTVTGGSQTTDAQGVATVGGWVLGASTGVDYTLVATVAGSGISNNPVVFTARPAALNLAITAGDNQSAEVNFTVAVRPQVRVTDAAGNGVRGVVIGWSMTQGSGAFSPTTLPTDPQGYATLDYFGPMTIGSIRLRATAADPRVQPRFVEFTLTGTPKP